MKSRHEPSEAVAGKELSAGWRSLLSFLIFLHLFALLVAVTSQHLGSVLTTKLRRVPDLSAVPGIGSQSWAHRLPQVQNYLQMLNMDLGYAFHLSSGGPDVSNRAPDTEFAWEGDFALPGETQKSQFPEPGTWPRQRRNRFAALGRLAAHFASTDRLSTSETVLAGGIAAGWAHEHRATAGTVRLMRRDLPRTVLPPETTESVLRPVFEYDLVAMGDRIEVQKKNPRSDTAAPAAPKGQP